MGGRSAVSGQRTQKPMPLTARDPHHNGACEWGWDGSHLWHRQRGERWWVMVRRIHPTPARVRMLSGLMLPVHQLLQEQRPQRDPLV